MNIFEGKINLGRGISKCKIFDIGMCFVWVRNEKEVRVVGVCVKGVMFLEMRINGLLGIVIYRFM